MIGRKNHHHHLLLLGTATNMSSGFVPAGTSADDNASSREPTAQDEAWLAAQKQIDASRQAERAALGKGTQEGGKTLFDVLQANKGVYNTSTFPYEGRQWGNGKVGSLR